MQELARSTIAKLLATENITVVQDKVTTAMFDVKHRVLTLPMWADVETFTEDHLIGHEVGHALYTPLEGWHDAVCRNGSAYKSYLNVVEDARIEKLIQRKYPGLRAPFIKSYKKMMVDGFFGGDMEEVNRMALIDRLNVYFKCGLTAGVKFTAEEMQWIPRIEALETWEEVVELVDELFQLEKEKIEAQEPDPMDMDDLDDDMEGSDGMAMEDGDGDGENEHFGPGDADEDEFEDDMDDMESGSQGQGGLSDPMKSKTDENLRDKISEELVDHDSRDVRNIVLAEVDDWSDFVMPYKKVFQRHDEHLREYGDRDYNKEAHIYYREWQRVNKKAVNHMVKEFEMRKSAAEYARASIAKTGVIDTVKMNNYKMTDDIFKKVTILPEGKNHGFIMYLDMSGSMAQHMYETVEQLLTLVHFARQINVPFRVYGFSNILNHKTYAEMDTTKRTIHDNNIGGYHSVAYASEVTLVELFTDKMSRGDMTRMSQDLLYGFSTSIHKKRWNKEFRQHLGCQWHYLGRLPIFQLGGTPLDEALVVGVPLAREFRQANRIDVLNTILLTDGQSHQLQVTQGGTYLRGQGNGQYLSLTCQTNNKTYRIKRLPERYGMATDVLLDMYRDLTGSNIIGYFIERQTQSAFENAYTMMSGRRASMNWDDKDKIKKFRKDGWYKVENPVGYDECYIISDKSLSIAESTMEDLRPDATKSRIRSAFKKAQGGSKSSRKMLSDLIERVA